ncbi:MAG TPA: nucleotide exchange factor GrpE [Bacillota bacterium]|nr:nucleotide exchange factor GrpE [Bacillota bacterium]
MSKKHPKEKAENQVNAATEDILQAADGEPVNQEAPQANTEVDNQNSELLAKLQQIEAEKEELHNRLLRCQADFDNFRRRSRQEYEQACLYGGEDLLKKILPALDSLERAVAACNNEVADNSGLKDGVQLTLKQFQNILTAEGLEVVESLNQAFDPQVHEAVLQEQTGEVGEPTVVQELQKGYKYKNKLLRPALVKVAVP